MRDYLILQSQTFRQPVQVGDVGFQRPRAGRPVMIILRQRPANHLSLEVLRRFAQIAASRQRQKAFRRRRG